MNLEQKIGQLFLIGFQGDNIDASHPIAADITQRNLGGVILFDRSLATKQAHNNIQSADQVKLLAATLQGLAHTPLFIGVDQEGGKVRRLKPELGFPATASAAELGQKNDMTLTAIHAATTADTLQALGINLNLAPVVDVNSFAANPVIGRLDRSFSPSPETISTHASEWIKVHRTRGVLSCLKHFPGHGSSRTDSHLGFTDITGTWSPEELQPYKDLIKSGLADAIMTGHLFHKELDPTYPATLSTRIIANLLRQELQFSGMVISDDLQMKAITDRYGLEEAACLALAAGVDLLIIGNNLDYNPDILARIIPAILQAIRSGKLQEKMIHEAYARIQQLKKKAIRSYTE
ncbi:MAG: glycoside hydrolase family 3 N-terminal domain-containing protein [Desulfocapsaceae bacterium]|nr:glycoside hydrolase family 3 N-terminal domain-containing protein [Desulfocapsaceae bacterium]